MLCRQTDFDLGSGFALGEGGGGGRGVSLELHVADIYVAKAAFGLSAVLSCACEFVLLSSNICLQQWIFNKGLLQNKHIAKGKQWKEG